MDLGPNASINIVNSENPSSKTGPNTETLPKYFLETRKVINEKQKSLSATNYNDWKSPYEGLHFYESPSSDFWNAEFAMQICSINFSH